MTQCFCTCCSHGIVDLDDRMAAFEAGRATGVIEGRIEHLNDVLDRDALRQAADLLNGVVSRTIAHLTGPEWAAHMGDTDREVTK